MSSERTGFSSLNEGGGRARVGGLLLLVTLAVLAGCARERQPVQPKAMIITGHRGASALAPENTLAALRKAIELGADYAEIDVAQTGDRQVILMHDATLDRTTDGSGLVRDWTLDSLRTLDAGNWFGPEFTGEPVPTLAEAIGVCRGRLKLNIEIKIYGGEQSLIDSVVQIIRGQSFQNQCMVTSFHRGSVERIKDLAPEIRAGLIFGPGYPPDIFSADFEILSAYSWVVDGLFVQNARRRGKEIHVWTVDDPLRMEELRTLGVDGIITNDPRVWANLQAAGEQAAWETDGLPLTGRGKTVFTVSLTDSGEGVLHAGFEPAAGRGVGQALAAVEVRIDSRRVSNLVVNENPARVEYDVALGHLDPGPHRVQLACPEAHVGFVPRLAQLRLAVYRSDHPLYGILRHAPILDGRPVMLHSDPPLVSFYEIRNQDAGREIVYSTVFSNEDGGTHPAGLMARWGRYTDIEWVSSTLLNGKSGVVETKFQGEGHETTTFRGQWEDEHPLLRVATLNNNFSDTLKTGPRFALAPVLRFTPRYHSRPHFMDEYPWTYDFSADELRREVLANPERADSMGMDDLRQYLNIDFWCQGNESGAYFAARFAGDTTWYTSHQGDPDLKLTERSTLPWRRTTIRLPSDKRIADLETLAFVALAAGDTAAIRLRAIGRVFQLDERYYPGASVFHWRGDKVVQAGTRVDRVEFRVGAE